MNGLDRTCCGSLFQLETVHGKNEYLYTRTVALPLPGFGARRGTKLAQIK